MEHFPATLSRAETDALIERIGGGLRASTATASGRSSCPAMARSRASSGSAPVDAATAAARPAVEIGWRLARAHWGRGIAREAATRRARVRASASSGSTRSSRITAVGNVRSRRLMERLGMRRDPAEDFDAPADRGRATRSRRTSSTGSRAVERRVAPSTARGPCRAPGRHAAAGARPVQLAPARDGSDHVGSAAAASSPGRRPRRRRCRCRHARGSGRSPVRSRPRRRPVDVAGDRLARLRDECSRRALRSPADSGPAGGSELLPGSVVHDAAAAPTRDFVGEALEGRRGRAAGERVELPPLRAPERDVRSGGGVAVADDERSSAAPAGAASARTATTVTAASAMPARSTASPARAHVHDC